ncbi:MAG: Ig-like domain-containing protein [Salinibacter sp.]
MVAWGLFGVAALLLVSCANPQAPSGGPRDTTPPTVVDTRPVRDTVSVSTDTEVLRIEFSEYIERSSFSQALSVTPAFEQQLQFDWGGRAVGIEFPASLRDSTTYIFTLDTNLSDAHGVSLESPITVAFSTGPKINRGQIEGRVVGAYRGRPKQQVDVYAYLLAPDEVGPRPLPDRPRYRTQTGEEGRFGFDYMREARYYVIALRDNNRNRTPDPGESFAVPPRLALQADSGAGAVPVPWLFAQSDTAAPRLQQVRPVSRQRVRLGFDEPVRLQTRAAAAWAPRDSVTGTRVDVKGVYAVPGRENAVGVRTAPMEETRHVLPLERGAVTDTVGRPLVPDTARFRAAAREDTIRTRFRGFLPADLGRDSTGARPLLPGVQPGVRFNQSLDSTQRRAGVRIRDTTGAPRPASLSTVDGIRYRIQFESPLSPGRYVDVEVRGDVFARADTTYRRRFRRVTRRVLGELEGRVRVADTARDAASAGRAMDDTTALRLPAGLTGRAEADTLTVPSVDTAATSPEGPRARLDSLFYGGPVAIALEPVESSVPVAPRRLTTSPDSTFVFDQLPDGQYRFRAYLDRNENGRWDVGQVQPYRPAEPVTWLGEPVEARPRWTTELPAPLRLPVLAPVPRSQESPPPDTTRPRPGEN